MQRYKISNTSAETANAPAKAADKTAVKGHPHASQKQTARPDWLLPAILAAVAVVLGGALLSLALTRHRAATSASAPAHRNQTSANQNQAADTQPRGVIGSVPAAVRDGVVAAVELKQFANLKKFFAPQVHVVIAGTSTNTTVSADQALQLLTALAGATNPWNWNISAAQLAQWQAGPDGQFFTGNVIVGESANGVVVSFTVDNSGQITGVFIAPSADLLSPSGSTGTTGGTSTPPPASAEPDNPAGVD